MSLFQREPDYLDVVKVSLILKFDFSITKKRKKKERIKWEFFLWKVQSVYALGLSLQNFKFDETCSATYVDDTLVLIKHKDNKDIGFVRRRLKLNFF